jgi:hypothetical protein
VTDDGSAGAPIDVDRLDLIRDRLAGDDRFTSVDWRPADAPDRLVFEYDTRCYPESVEAATLSVVWFENGDFSIHYHEDHDRGSFDYRWDRHPSEHNDRDHLHLGPDASTPGEDVSHPLDWRDVLSGVPVEIEERQRAFWRD